MTRRESLSTDAAPRRARLYVAFDDTDTIDADRGTGKVGRWFEDELPDGCRLWAVVRQQLLVHPDVPYTSHNSAAVCVDRRRRPALTVAGEAAPTARRAGCRRASLSARSTSARQAPRRRHWMDGSDPGLCVAWDGCWRDAGARRLRPARRRRGRDAGGGARGRRGRAPQRARRHRGRDHRRGRRRRPHGRRLERPPHRVPQLLRPPARRPGAGLASPTSERPASPSSRSTATRRCRCRTAWCTPTAGCGRVSGPAGRCCRCSATAPAAGSRRVRGRPRAGRLTARRATRPVASRRSPPEPALGRGPPADGLPGLTAPGRSPPSRGRGRRSGRRPRPAGRACRAR